MERKVDESYREGFRSGNVSNVLSGGKNLTTTDVSREDKRDDGTLGLFFSTRGQPAERM